MSKIKFISSENMFFLSVLLILTSCNTTVNPTPTPTPNPTPTTSPSSTPMPSPSATATPTPVPTPNNAIYQQINLVGDTNEHNVPIIDINLKNAWGIVMSPTGNFWITANKGGVSTIYDKDGVTRLSPVTIPTKDSSTGGTPTGLIYNSTNDFVIPSNSARSNFIFASEDGTVSSWNSGTSAIKVIDRSSNDAVYKGIALGSVGTSNYIYLANFKGKRIDVFDKNFILINNMPFTDPEIPGEFSPFNIQNIGGKLYVTYAKLKAPDNKDDQAGAGNGYVDIFNTDGSFIQRFATQGTLNSPWGIVKAPAGFGKFANNILVGNFGDGSISAFDESGNYKGQLMDKDNHTIRIDGLWGLSFIENSAFGNVNNLYFAAGPAAENHGIFGYLKKSGT